MALTGPLLVLLGMSSLTLTMTNNCSQCVITTEKGRITSRTLIYHTVYDYKDQKIGSYIYNLTQYALCREKTRTICYDPKEHPYQYWVEIRTNLENGRLIRTNKIIANLNTPVSVTFNAYDTIDDNLYTNCENIDWRRHRILFNSFYHKVETEVKYEVPIVAKNMFINLAKNITKSLNVTVIFVVEQIKVNDGLLRESLPIIIQLRGQKMNPGVTEPQYICLIK